MRISRVMLLGLLCRSEFLQAQVEMFRTLAMPRISVMVDSLQCPPSQRLTTSFLFVFLFLHLILFPLVGESSTALLMRTRVMQHKARYFSSLLWNWTSLCHALLPMGLMSRIRAARYLTLPYKPLAYTLNLV